jgi:uncharacterized phage infection (PIP) family protein YhgE
MKKLVLNDSRQIEVQSAVASGGVFHARMINTSVETLEAMFSSEFATQKMTLVENGKVTNTFENYKVFKSVKKECGGIYEVELVQEEADTATKIANLEKMAQDNAETIEQGLAEITMLISSLVGGVADVQ